MTTLLQLNASIFGDAGQSSRLADEYVTRWSAAHSRGKVIRRHLASDPVPHLDAARFQAFTTAPEARTPEQQGVVAYSDGLIAELQRADVIVLGLPMYNFGVPSGLKAYFDHIARAGITFRYTATGSVGLLTGKRVLVFAARGGLYEGTANDLQTQYVRQFLAFLGMTDIEFVYAEGLAMGDTAKEAGIARADAALRTLADAEWRMAA